MRDDCFSLSFGLEAPFQKSGEPSKGQWVVAPSRPEGAGESAHHPGPAADLANHLRAVEYTMRLSKPPVSSRARGNPTRWGDVRWAKCGCKKVVLLSLSALLLVGCANPAAYREPVTRFQQASTVVIESARIEYGQANTRERNAEIDTLASRQERLDLDTLDSKDLRVLGGDDLAARMAALEALAKQGELLLALASSDAPTRANDAANSFDDAVIGLSKALGRVPSDEFKNTAAGFSTIGAEVSRLALDKKVDHALAKAITLSENDVQRLLRLLRDDLTALYERRRSMLSAARVSAIDEYNEEVKKARPNPEKLERATVGVKNAEDAWDVLPLLLGAGPGLDAMAQAHQELVDYAKSPKNPQDLSDLVEATDAFASRAKVISDAINAIRRQQG
ncbi:MAG: hypothetical protein ACXW1N_08695 [Halobacteriota archaeon]